jgi:hypothetical protein
MNPITNIYSVYEFEKTDFPGKVIGSRVTLCLPECIQYDGTPWQQQAVFTGPSHYEMAQDYVAFRCQKAAPYFG